MLSCSRYFSARALHWRIIGSSFASTVRSASSSEGYTNMVGAGSWSIRLPRAFSMAEVPPTWVGLTNTIFSVVSFEKASMISTRYGVTLFFHGPGMAFPLGRTRFRSAHTDTLTRSLGRRISMAGTIHRGTL